MRRFERDELQDQNEKAGAPDAPQLLENTVNYNDYLKRVMSHATPLPFETDLHHMCLGLTSEAGEIADAIKALMVYGKPLDPVNVGEEGGDGLWFAGGLAMLLKLDFDELVTAACSVNGVHTDKRRLNTYSAWLCDAAAALHMRVCAFTDERVPLPLPSMAAELMRYIRTLRRITECFGIPIERVAAGNIAKLDHRYGGGSFDAQKGLNRDKVAERSVLARALGLEEAVAA